MDFSKHLGGSQDFVADGVTYKLYPIGTESLSDYMKLVKFATKIQQRQKEQPDNEMLAFELMDEDTILTIRTVIEKTLEKSFPEQWKDDTERELLKSFGLKYMIQLLFKILELNSPTVTDDDKRKIEQLEKLKTNK